MVWSYKDKGLVPSAHLFHVFNMGTSEQCIDNQLRIKVDACLCPQPDFQALTDPRMPQNQLHSVRAMTSIMRQMADRKSSKFAVTKAVQAIVEKRITDEGTVEYMALFKPPFNHEDNEWMPASFFHENEIANFEAGVTLFHVIANVGNETRPDGDVFSLIENKPKPQTAHVDLETVQREALKFFRRNPKSLPNTSDELAGPNRYEGFREPIEFDEKIFESGRGERRGREMCPPVSPKTIEPGHGNCKPLRTNVSPPASPKTVEPRQARQGSSKGRKRSPSPPASAKSFEFSGYGQFPLKVPKRKPVGGSR
jgi:hypothetical protein